MTRKEIETQYDVKHGTIVSPGKFEQTPVWAPYFWDLGMNDGADVEDSEGGWIFCIDSSDVERFPELQYIKTVTMWEDDNGFVQTRVVRR